MHLPQREPPRKETISSESCPETRYSTESDAEPRIAFPVPMIPPPLSPVEEVTQRSESPAPQDLPEPEPKRRVPSHVLVTEWLAGLGDEPLSPPYAGCCLVAHPCGCRPSRTHSLRRRKSGLKESKPRAPILRRETLPLKTRRSEKENDRFLRSAGKAFEVSRLSLCYPPTEF